MYTSNQMAEAGDEVECVDGKGSLSIGTVYHVAEIDAVNGWIELKEMPGLSWAMSRFLLRKRAKKPPPTDDLKSLLEAAQKRHKWVQITRGVNGYTLVKPGPSSEDLLLDDYNEVVAKLREWAEPQDTETQHESPVASMTLRDFAALVEDASEACESSLNLIWHPGGRFEICSRTGQSITVSGEAGLIEKLRELAKPPKPKEITVSVTLPFEDAEEAAALHVPMTLAGKALYEACRDALKPWLDS